MRFVLFAYYNEATGQSTNAYVQDCDVDAFGGQGHVTFTRVPSLAKQFMNAAEAMTYWQRQSTVLPLRPDGMPNRPLTAYTVEVRALKGTADGQGA
jgi:hypothetical protein